MFRNSVVPPSSGSVRTLNLSSSATVKRCHSTTQCSARQERPGMAQSLSWWGYRMDYWQVSRGSIPGTIDLSLYHSIRSEAGGPPTLVSSGYKEHCPQRFRCWGVKLQRTSNAAVVTRSLWRAEHKGNFAFLTEVMKQEQSDRKQHHSAVPQHSCRLANCYRLSSDVSGAASQFWFSTPTCGYDKVDRQLKNINHSLA